MVGNFIGTTKTGYVALPNQLGGLILSDCQRNTVGGTEPGARNIISGNLQDGVFVEGPPDFSDENQIPDSNHVVGNFIGLKPNSTPLPNGRNGVNIVRGRNNVFESKVIRFNQVRMQSPPRAGFQNEPHRGEQRHQRQRDEFRQVVIS